MSDRVRLMRLLIYEGEREWVEKTVAKSIHGRLNVPSSSGSITAVSLTVFPLTGTPPSRGAVGCDAQEAVNLAGLL